MMTKADLYNLYKMLDDIYDLQNLGEQSYPGNDWAYQDLLDARREEYDEYCASVARIIEMLGCEPKDFA